MSSAEPIRAVVLTSSDRCASGTSTDLSGPAVCEFIRERLKGVIVQHSIVADESQLIEAFLREWSDPTNRIDLAIVTGGTGLSPRDVTPEAAMKVIDRPHPGLMELARARTGAVHPRAYLSRGVAGAARSTLIIAVPGSPRGATETLEAIADILPHALALLRGEPTIHPSTTVPIVLVGGRSKRFGRDKLREPLQGKSETLVERPIRALRGVYGPRVVLVGNCHPEVARLGDGLLADGYPDCGPAGGILTALEHHGEVFVLSGDLPGVTIQLVEAIDRAARAAPHAHAVIAESADGMEPCIGIYRPGAIDALRGCLAEGQSRSLHEALSHLNCVRVAMDPSQLINANRPQDLDELTQPNIVR